jgi:hypothetical protein
LLRLLDRGAAPSVANRTLRLVEGIERRVAWVAISVAITLAFNTSGTLAYGIGGVGRWELTFYVGGLFCLAAAGVWGAKIRFAPREMAILQAGR